ncbi:MAG: hypothetical protein AW07_03533 [Candidatus Accumulibacter sp. SK-11]|nr:MAG: hypothetical protein AW07_03533 [Candidatus Accumulibacter sp. SK-11]
MVVCTKSMIARLAAPSFHEGKGSVCACRGPLRASNAVTAKPRAKVKNV